MSGLRVSLAALLMLGSACAHVAPKVAARSELCQKAQEGAFGLVFDGGEGVLRRPANRIHEGTRVNFCVENADLRYRVTTAVVETALPPPDNTTWQPKAGRARDQPAADPAVPQLAAAPKKEGEQNPLQKQKKQLDAAIEAARELIKRVRPALEALGGALPVPEGQKGVLQRQLSPPDSPLTLAAETEAAEQLRVVSADSPDKTNLDESLKKARDLLEELPRWNGVAETARSHLAATPPALSDVSVGSDTKVEVTVKGTRLVLKVEKVRGAEVPALTTVTEELAKTSFEVRALTWGRVSPGLALSEVVSQRYSVAPNEVGASVITGKQDAAMLPVLFLGHYWSPVDVRETQPYDRSRKWWGLNLLPSFTVGLPLTRDPLENLFVGLLAQPVPGISLIAGYHYGYIDRLRREFVEGGAPPPAATGFRIEDALEQRWTRGTFLGVALSDALFMSFLQSLTK